MKAYLPHSRIFSSSRATLVSSVVRLLFQFAPVGDRHRLVSAAPLRFDVFIFLFCIRAELKEVEDGIDGEI